MKARHIIKLAIFVTTPVWAVLYWRLIALLMEVNGVDASFASEASAYIVGALAIFLNIGIGLHETIQLD